MFANCNKNRCGRSREVQSSITWPPMRTHLSKYIQIIKFTVAFAILICISNAAFSAEWFLVRVEKAELYSAVAAHRVEATLVQASDRLVRLWVRTDYLRPKNYKYPDRPRLGAGNVIGTDAYLWDKDQVYGELPDAADHCRRRLVPVGA